MTVNRPLPDTITIVLTINLVTHEVDVVTPAPIVYADTEKPRAFMPTKK